jgi:hypothetical protein
MDSTEANGLLAHLRKVLGGEEISVARLGPIYADIGNIWRAAEKHYGTTLALILLFQGKEEKK